MIQEFFGQFIALGAAAVFTITSTMFTLAGHKYKSLHILRIYLPVALVGLTLLHKNQIDTFLPANANTSHWILFGMSGILGYGFSMMFIINAFERVGPRLAFLVTSISPIMSAIFAWIFFQQTLAIKSLLGVIVTLSGIVWVISDKREVGQHKDFRGGVMFAGLSALSQSIGFIFSTKGLENDFEPISGAVLRIIVATIVIWTVLLLAQYPLPKLDIKSREFQYVMIGTVTGPIMGALLVLIALDNVEVGIATTLFNTTPIFMLPVGYLVFHEHISRRAIVGTFIAVIGIALFFI